MKKILFITNGHGEDIVAAQVIRHMNLRGKKIDVLPVVGRGEAFKGLRVNLIGPLKALPSGGFGLRNYSFLIKDIFAGLLGKIIAQVNILRRSHGKYDLVIGIGDIVPILFSLIAGGKKIFVGINKSDYYSKLAFNYTSLEKRLLKRYFDLTFARDKRTEEALTRDGIKTVFVGNPMMDLIQNIRRSGHKKNRKDKTIGFLPGTREDAFKNIEDFQKIAWQINRLDRKVEFLMSFPPSLDKEKLAHIRTLAAIKISNDFNDVLASSDIIVGLSGTGNEQAAGSGKPVISFPGRGAQYNFKFAAAQKELLGDSLLLMPRNSQVIAHEAISLLFSKKRLAAMSKAGKERMGKAGASKKIAGMITKSLQKR